MFDFAECLTRSARLMCRESRSEGCFHIRRGRAVAHRKGRRRYGGALAAPALSECTCAHRRRTDRHPRLRQRQGTANRPHHRCGRAGRRPTAGISYRGLRAVAVGLVQGNVACRTGALPRCLRDPGVGPRCSGRFRVGCHPALCLDWRGEPSTAVGTWCDRLGPSAREPQIQCL